MKNGANSKQYFCSGGLFGKGTPFVGVFQTKVNNWIPSRKALPQGIHAMVT